MQDTKAAVTELAALAPAALGADALIPVERKDETLLSNLSAWVLYRLMREGKLPHVRVGRRRYMTADGIARFLANGGEGQAA